MLLDEPARFDVGVWLTDSQPFNDLPEDRLFVLLKGVIAQCPTVKFVKREPRRTLYRAWAREVLASKVLYRCSGVPRSPDGLVHVVIHEPKAMVVRGVFAEFSGAPRSAES